MTETAVLGTGCFWCSEAIFSRLKGVTSVLPGYAGGKVENPTYEQVSTGTTGHAEVAKITFDPKVIDYSTLLDVFWHLHDPTTPDRQGADIGPQYRSLILFLSPSQKQIAEKSKSAIQKSFPQPIVTEIKPLETFYEAEDYHHKYFENHRDQPYCRVIIEPKIQKLLQKYPDRVTS